MQGNAMLRIAQERFPCRLRCEYARPAFDAEFDLEAAGTSNEADDGLREMDVEIVADDVPLCSGSGTAEQAAEKPREILFGPGVADNARNLSRGDVESGDQGLIPTSDRHESGYLYPRKRSAGELLSEFEV